MIDPTAPILAPRASHKVPADVIKGVLGQIREKFYPRCDDPHALKLFCVDRSKLVEAITYPAAFLTQKMGDGCPLAWHQYEEILRIVLATIEREGNLAQIRNFSRYFLHCVQTHMPHNWERYYAMAKGTRHLIDAAMSAVQPADRAPVDSTVRDLAAMHADLRLNSGRPKAAKAAPAKAPKPARDSKRSESRDSNSGIQKELF